MNSINELVEALKEAENKGPKPFDTLAEVMRIEDDIAWVQMPGSDDETPVRMTIAAKEGDTVQVRVSGGTAFLVGNATAPPTDDKEAFEAQEQATDAKRTAQEATDTAIQAVQDAEIAHLAADEAQMHANTAREAADGALTQLSIIEDVAGTLDWITEHGSYTATTDTSVVTGKIYFTYNSSTHDYSPVISPADNANPRTNGWYELSISDSQTEFIMAHLAVTSRGLWVLPSGKASGTTPASGETQSDSDARQASNYKALFASNGTYIYDSSGNQVAVYGMTSIIGNPNGLHVEVKPDGFYLYNGINVLASLTASAVSFISGLFELGIHYDSDGNPYVAFTTDNSINNMEFQKDVLFWNKVHCADDTECAYLNADRFELTEALDGPITDWTAFFRGYSQNGLYIDDWDANSISINSFIYIASNKDAADWNHLPSSSAGFLFTFISDRKAQIYWTRNADNNIYVRNSQTGTWSDWKQITVQEKTTTLTSITPSGAAIPSGSYGGYYTEGKHCYVYVRCRLNSAWSSGGGNVTLFTGLPEPAFAQPVLPVMVANAANGVAWVNDSGNLVIKPETAISTSNFIVINGHYVIS